MKSEPLNLSTIRTRLATTHGKQYWRSLEEIADTKGFQEFVQREFPAQASEWHDELSRRQFLKIMGASFALAGLSACMKMPEEKIVPYVRQPEEIIPGNPLFFATAVTLGGYATGLLVESHEGRPTKIEGNSLHPASLGATDAFTQASILALYDPDRSQVVNNAGQISTWSEFLAALRATLENQNASQGAALRILTETISSPTLSRQIAAVLEKFPQAKWHQYEPLARDNVLEGARLAFGEAVETRYHFDKADLILALDADFLFSGPGWVRYAREFADKRRMRTGRSAMNRLYVVEPTPSTTGAMADHRLAVRASLVEDVARAIAGELGLIKETKALSDEGHNRWIKVAVRDLQKNRGASIVLVGDQQPPAVHALVHSINDALGNTNQTVSYTEPVAAHPVNQRESLRELVQDMHAGVVEALMILGGNPVYNAPMDFRFADAMSKVKLRIHHALGEDETSQLCHWHIPEAHYLETWSDARAFDGTATIQQPLIAPLYDGKSAHEFVAALLGHTDQTSHDIVRDYWKAHGLEDDNSWHATLHDGVVPGSAFGRKAVTPRSIQNVEISVANGMELVFLPDSTIWDGRFANNGWLQELPKPLTRLTWDNVALVSPATGEKLGLSNEDVVELQLGGQTMRAPIWIVPGQANQTVVVTLGYGRTHAGHVGNGAGFNAYNLRQSGALWFAQGLEIRKTGERHSLSCTQHHQTMEGRDLVRVGTINQFEKNPSFAHNEINQPSLYPPYKYDGYAWGMAIDQTACVGCSACVVACQSENNIPIVGKDQVARGREMHWIRIDRYFQGELDSPAIYFEPVPCMHCENAPCEVVCPVGATQHSNEGLNEMVYNRCIGTRYCSNNCPYKVRRFNFLQYSDVKTPSLKMLMNPNVTVRNRGVMEKCTYCIQRIQAVKITAETGDRKICDGEIIPACGQVCPTQAIVFGDINDPTSQVARLKAQPHNYGLLVEVNARPRTTYLARIRNPNPEIEA
jgi:molybdopterin-containing oxidoreductase family iron-sulfur binding subunit